uniref:Uncharacterized protein n=1 Tax=Arundo donax TaxID=35708 RepID=A0A0A9F4Z9_ARUDO
MLHSWFKMLLFISQFTSAFLLYTFLHPEILSVIQFAGDYKQPVKVIKDLAQLNYLDNIIYLNIFQCVCTIE